MITRKRKFGKASTTDSLLIRGRLGLKKYRKTSKRDPDKKEMLLELALKKIEKAERSNFISVGYQKRRVNYAGDRIKIIIPSDKVIFIDENGKLKVELVRINVYRGNENECEITENKILSFSEEEVLELYEIIIEVPYTPTKKGEYSFDVAVTDLKAEYLSKYRQFIKHVFRTNFVETKAF